MRHRRAHRKFSLPSDQRRALLKGLTRSLLLHDKILTTETRAKEIQPIVEKLITMARRGGDDATPLARVHTRRLAYRYIDSNVAKFQPGEGGKTGSRKLQQRPELAVPRLFSVVAPRFVGRPGGYTRITKTVRRRGDGAPMVLLEFVEGIEPQIETTVQAAPAARRGILKRRSEAAE